MATCRRAAPLAGPLAGPLVAAVLAQLLCAGRALAGCTLGRLAELPVTMIGLRPTVPVKIDGADARFIVDSGAFYSSITPASAAQFKLHLDPAPYDLRIIGIGGSTSAQVATVKVFTLASIPLHGVQFVVGGSEVGGGAAGLLGQNILRIADTEYDLANGVVRLWRPKGCGKSNLAYWAKGEDVSVVDIDWTSVGEPHITGTALLNGKRIRVMFDTGSATSLLARRAAERAGFNPEAPGVQPAGAVRGIGSEIAKEWLGRFSMFELGGEQIRNIRLRVGDLALYGEDMLIGADFFLSHHVYVAPSQNRLYFTYNGGPVFDLSVAPARAAIAAASGSSSSAQSSAAAVAAEGPEPTDAEGFSRRGMAFAARRDFSRALADLTRACELAPTEPRYLFERARVRLANGERLLGRTDLDRALTLAPSDPAMLVLRAELRLADRDRSGAAADLDAADRALPKQADARLAIGALYLRAGLFARAVPQLDLWIGNHAEDSRKPEAFNDRCWARALWGTDLRNALRDCNTALRMRPGTVAFLDSRGLVEQRLGDFDRSLADYDAALQRAPRSAWILYARGVAELRSGRKAQGKADIAAAVDLQPRVVDLGRERGVVP